MKIIASGDIMWSIAKLPNGDTAWSVTINGEPHPRAHATVKSTRAARTAVITAIAEVVSTAWATKALRGVTSQPRIANESRNGVVADVLVQSIGSTTR